MESEQERALWEKTESYYRSTIKDKTDLDQIDRHFPQFKSKKFVGSELQIGVDNELQMDFFAGYLQPLTNALRVVGGEEFANGSVKFVLLKKNDSAVAPASSLPPEESQVKKEPVSEIRSFMNRPRTGTGSSMKMDDNYTFENFVKGPSNSFAYAEAVAVAKAPGRTAYNPLFLWGQTGLGKTHIMQAIGHRVLKNLPGASVCYITAENFLNEYVTAIQNDKIVNFRQCYRKVDLLLIDDVQFIAGKTQMQEEFFNTFTTLMTSHKQIVMTCDVCPRDLKNFEERLISRFEGGMVTEIEAPSVETRLAILKFKASSYHRIVPPEILNFIAENIRSHVRALEGALKRVVAFMEINSDIEITVDVVKKLLHDQIQNEQVIKDLSIDSIQNATATYYNVTVKDILSDARPQNIVTPRQVAMFLSRKLTTLPMQQIGLSFKKKHPTIHHALKTIQDRLANEPKLRNDITEITVKLGRSPSEIFSDGGSDD